MVLLMILMIELVSQIKKSPSILLIQNLNFVLSLHYIGNKIYLYVNKAQFAKVLIIKLFINFV